MMILSILFIGCEKIPDDENPVLKAPADYDYFSEQPSNNLLDYVYVFWDKNPFTVSFWYSGELYNSSAKLFSVTGDSKIITVYVDNNGIHYKRFDTNIPHTSALIYYSNTLYFGRHHIVITYDGSYQSIYVDGNGGGGIISPCSINSAKILFESLTGSEWIIPGIITNTYFYSRLLSKKEIIDLYNLNR